MEQVIEEYTRLVREVSERSETLFHTYAAQIRCRRGCYYCCEEISVLPIEIEAVRLWLSEPGTEVPDVLKRRAGSGIGLRRLGDDGRVSVDRTPEGILPHGFGLHADAPDAVTEQTTVGAGTASPKQPATRCAMLDGNGACMIYPARPLICRTHGLPLAYRVYEYDEYGLPVREDDQEYMDLWCDMNFTTIEEKDSTSYFDANGRLNMDEINIRLGGLNGRFMKTAAGRRYEGHDRLPLQWLLLPA